MKEVHSTQEKKKFDVEGIEPGWANTTSVPYPLHHGPSGILVLIHISPQPNCIGRSEQMHPYLARLSGELFSTAAPFKREMPPVRQLASYYSVN